MINILIKTDSHYRVNRERVRAMVKKILTEKKVKGEIEVSLNIVGDRLMKALNEKYGGQKETIDVLAFSLLNEKATAPLFVDPPDGVLRLGDIIISYPQAREAAAEENKLVEDKIEELVIHGMKHLLGNHHEE